MCHDKEVSSRQQSSTIPVHLILRRTCEIRVLFGAQLDHERTCSLVAVFIFIPVESNQIYADGR